MYFSVSKKTGRVDRYLHIMNKYVGSIGLVGIINRVWMAWRWLTVDIRSKRLRVDTASKINFRVLGVLGDIGDLKGEVGVSEVEGIVTNIVGACKIGFHECFSVPYLVNRHAGQIVLVRIVETRNASYLFLELKRRRAVHKFKFELLF